MRFEGLKTLSPESVFILVFLRVVSLLMQKWAK